MVLVEITHFVVDVDGCWYRCIKLHRQIASARVRLCIAFDAVVDLSGLNLIRHDIEWNAKRQENDTEDDEDYHCGAVAWDWPPRNESLLLEPVSFQRCEFIFSALHLLLTNFHLININLARKYENLELNIYTDPLVIRSQAENRPACFDKGRQIHALEVRKLRGEQAITAIAALR